jgi:hypothetical protein
LTKYVWGMGEEDKLRAGKGTSINSAGKDEQKRGI